MKKYSKRIFGCCIGNKKNIISLLSLWLLFGGCSINDEPASNKLELEKLKAQPYLSHTSDKVNKDQSGVTIYNPGLACDGYNIYKNYMMDMEGQIVHKWKGTLLTILEDGDIIARFQKKLQRYDQNLRPIWETDFEIHHEVILTAERNILTLSQDVHKYNNRNVIFDVILELSLDGDEIIFFLFPIQQPKILLLYFFIITQIIKLCHFRILKQHCLG